MYCVTYLYELKEWLAFYPLSKVSTAKFSILYYLSLVIGWNEKLVFNPSKISAAKFSILYYPITGQNTKGEHYVLELKCWTFAKNWGGGGGGRCSAHILYSTMS